MGVYDDGTKTAYTNGDNNQLTAAGSESFLYDFFGNMVNVGDGVASQDFEYNWERNMTQTYFDEASADSHEYDGDGRRMRSKLNAAANWTNFVHDELTEQVLGEYTLISSTFTLKAANTYGWGLVSSNREGTKRYFHFDGLGNTMALTDASEVVQDTYVWTAFGLLSTSSGSSVNPYRYVGQWGYYDDGAMGSPHGFLLLGVRYYAPEYGRFLTWDPIGSRGYGYCGNAGTMAIDPGGLSPQEDFRFGGGLEDIVNPPRSMPPQPRPKPKPRPQSLPALPPIGTISGDFPFGDHIDPSDAACEAICSMSRPNGVLEKAQKKWCKIMCDKIRQGGCKMLDEYCKRLCGGGQKFPCEACLAFYDAAGCPGSLGG